MIPHKYPGIQIELARVEVIWLHYSRFYMDLEKGFDNRIHVFKEPNGVKYISIIMRIYRCFVN